MNITGLIEPKRKPKNNGFALLKMFMCFEVVINHSLSQFDGVLMTFLCDLSHTAVPVFMILSFIFVSKKMDDITYIKKRIKSLLFLQVSWAIIYYVIMTICHYIIQGELLSIKLLFSQALFGVGLNTFLWFQFDLIVITFIFALLFRLIKDNRNRLWFFLVIIVLCYYLQSSSINYNFFHSLGEPLKYPFGRVIEMMPYACIGILFGLFDILKTVSNDNELFIIYTIFLIMLDIYCPSFTTYGFYYSGIENLFKSILLVMLFNKMNEYIKSNKIVDYITRFTPGIYFTHKMAYTILSKLYELFSFSIYYDFIIVYLACYLFCYFVDKIPNKFIKKLVN